MSFDPPTPDEPGGTTDPGRAAGRPIDEAPVDYGAGPTRSRIITIAIVVLAIALVIAGFVSRHIVQSSRRVEPAGGIARSVYAAPRLTAPPALAGAAQDVPDLRPTASDVDRFNQAIAIIRSTPQFRTLPDWLRANDVRFALSDWAMMPGTAAEYHADTNRVLLDIGYIRSVRPVVLASLIVHETIHAQRHASGLACDPCTEVVPGAIFEEELPAYDAQARFLRYWIDRGEVAELPMATAHRAGADAFAWYVWNDLAQR